MFHRLPFAALTVCLLLPLHAQAQETYTIKLKKSVKGSWTREQRVDTELDTSKITDNDGKVLQEKDDSVVQTLIYDQTVLERPDVKKKPTALKRTYEKATVTIKKETKVLPYQGKSVLIEKKGEKFQFRYEGGGEITGEDAKWLNKEFNDKKDDDFDIDAVLQPKNPVKAGETWKIPMAEIIKSLEKENLVLYADKCQGTGKLVKAYKQDGRQFGDLLYKFEIPLKAIKTKDGDIVMQAGVALIMELKASACIDGSVEDAVGQITQVFNGVGLFPSADNPQARFTFATRNQLEASTKEVLKK
jgi:hypothetical protein